MDENKKLLELHAIHNNKWKEISVEFPGRTDNGIKNQFFSIIRKSLRKAYKASGTVFSTKLINNLRPKILSDFLNVVLEIPSGQNNPVSKKYPIRNLIERFYFNKINEISFALSEEDHLLIKEGLKKLKQMK